MAKRRTARSGRTAVYLLSMADSRELADTFGRAGELVAAMAAQLASLRYYVERLELVEAARAARRSKGAKQANATRAVAAQIAGQGDDLGDAQGAVESPAPPPGTMLRCANCGRETPDTPTKRCMYCGMHAESVS